MDRIFLTILVLIALAVFLLERGHSLSRTQDGYCFFSLFALPDVYSGEQRLSFCRFLYTLKVDTQ